MRRALLAAALLAVPLLGGFECEVTLWAPGDTCTVGGGATHSATGTPSGTVMRGPGLSSPRGLRRRMHWWLLRQ